MGTRTIMPSCMYRTCVWASPCAHFLSPLLNFLEGCKQAWCSLLCPYSGTENLVKYLFSAAERTNRIKQVRDGSTKDNEIWSWMITLKMFWRKKGRGTSEQKLYLVVPVMFMCPLVVCFNNHCFRPYMK